MSTPTPERSSFEHPVGTLISQYGRLWAIDTSFNDWATAASQLSKFNVDDRSDRNEKANVFVNAFRPSPYDRSGYVDKIAAILHRENRPSGEGLRKLGQKHVAQSEASFVKRYVPFHIDTVQRILLDIAATKDIENLRARIKYLEANPEDPFGNIGAQLDKETASMTADIAVDGTRTATILAIEIIREEIAAFEELQHKLKEHLSPTKPSGEGEL